MLEFLSHLDVVLFSISLHPQVPSSGTKELINQWIMSTKCSYVLCKSQPKRCDKKRKEMRGIRACRGGGGSSSTHEEQHESGQQPSDHRSESARRGAAQKRSEVYVAGVGGANLSPHGPSITLKGTGKPHQGRHFTTAIIKVIQLGHSSPFLI